MRLTLFAVGVLILCAGCLRVGSSTGSVNHSKFFDTHDTHAYFNSVAAKEGIDLGCGGSGCSLGGRIGSKEYEYSLKGDKKIRDKIMADYKDYVENELNMSGVTITGRKVSGEVSGFTFDYFNNRLTGIVRVNSVIDENGYIVIDVFIYEHD